MNCTKQSRPIFADRAAEKRRLETDVSSTNLNPDAPSERNQTDKSILSRPVVIGFRVPHDIYEIIKYLALLEIVALLYIIRRAWGFPNNERHTLKLLAYDDLYMGIGRRTGRRWMWGRQRSNY